MEGEGAASTVLDFERGEGGVVQSGGGGGVVASGSEHVGGVGSASFLVSGADPSELGWGVWDADGWVGWSEAGCRVFRGSILPVLTFILDGMVCVGGSGCDLTDRCCDAPV